MSDRPLVSIGCAVYNGEKTLARALSALVEQDYPHLEIIIRDDGSTDGSWAICSAFAERDSRIRLIRNESNPGMIRNVNALFEAARGKYFMWADQDDLRDRTFVGKAVAALENDPEAVLCHSYTGAFIGEPSDLKHITTLDGVAGVEGVVRRYACFLRAFSDTAIYGLIRADALRQTHLWRMDLGAANALLFELLLQGKFIQIPEVLYLYSGRGPRNRTSPREDFRRTTAGREMPRFYVPFLVLAWNQTRDVIRSRLPLSTRGALAVVLWGNVAVANLGKAAYRTLYRLLSGRVPDAVTRACEWVVSSKAHIRFVDAANEDERIYPRGWTLQRSA